MRKDHTPSTPVLLLHEFLKDRKSRWCYIGSAFLLVALYFIFFQKKDLVLFPSSNETKVAFYTDIETKGNSYLTKTIANDSVIQMSFVLKEGYVAPYAGLNVAYTKKRVIDVSDYNRIELELTTHHITDLLVYLATNDKHVKNSAHRLAQRHLGENIEMKDGLNTFDLVFKSFKTADWWYTAIGQPQSDFTAPEWDQLVRVAIATGLTPKLDIASTLYIHKIRFHQNNALVLLLFTVIQIFVVLFVFAVFYVKKRRDQRHVSLSISYKAVEIQEKTKSGYSFLDYIHTHFIDPELSLAQIAKHTGINQRLISDTISEKFQCNFKTYVNQIRISEAKRLLKETELNISEIAYKVGFSSPGSFNRVFKTLTGLTPSEYAQPTDN